MPRRHQLQRRAAFHPAAKSFSRWKIRLQVLFVVLVVTERERLVLPDPEVRRQAKSLYDTLRGHPKLEPGVSPRRSLLGAFWWFRQAHLLSLGVTPDAPGAQRTRSKELRRSNEEDRAL